MAGYILRNINQALWKQVRERAAKDGVNLRQVFLWWLRLYAKHGLAHFGDVREVGGETRGRPAGAATPESPARP